VSGAGHRCSLAESSFAGRRNGRKFRGNEIQIRPLNDMHELTLRLLSCHRMAISTRTGVRHE
jgi:hypothetical protein